MSAASAEHGRIILFVCNWNAYGALEDAGRAGLRYPARVLPVRVPCAGCIHPGIILKAFELGAAGVIVAGCGPDQCRHGSGYRRAGDAFSSSAAMLKLLGIPEGRLDLEFFDAGDGPMLAEKINRFVERAGFEGERP